MAVPRTKKTKQGMYTKKQMLKNCRDTGLQVQLLMAVAIQDVLKVDNEQLMKVFETSARYSRYCDENLATLKDAAESIYHYSNGEIDLMGIEMRMRCQKNT